MVGGTERPGGLQASRTDEMPSGTLQGVAIKRGTADNTIEGEWVLPWSWSSRRPHCGIWGGRGRLQTALLKRVMDAPPPSMECGVVGGGLGAQEHDAVEESLPQFVVASSICTC